MAHTYTNCLVHYVFSTKYREPHLDSELRSRIWPFIGGIAREKGFRTIEVGGHTDEEEYIAFLEKNGVAYDPRYVFD